MKKILAIAVATAISAPAMADMTISGTVAAGYSSTTKNSAASYALDTTSSTPAVTTTAAKTGDGGFGIDTAALTISGSETTESGLTVSGSMSAGGFTRGGSVGGENASLAISGDFGKLSIGAVKVATDYIVALGGADNFAGEFAGESTVDSVSYTLPGTVGGMAVKVGFTDAIGIGTDNGDVDPYVQANGNVGPAAVHVRYRTFNKASTLDNQLQLGAVVDAGMVQVGAGYQVSNGAGSNADNTVTSFSVAVPMGAATLGASLVSDKTDGAEAVNGTSVAASYAITSNISASAKYNTWDADSDKVSSVSALVSLSF